MIQSTCCGYPPSPLSGEICGKCGMHCSFEDDDAELRPPRDERALEAWIAANELETGLTEDDDAEDEVSPRYAAYARSQDRTPEDMLAHDAEQYPGGLMAGFICWIAARKAEFRKAHPEAFNGPDIADQAAFDRWLQRFADLSTPLTPAPDCD